MSEKTIKYMIPILLKPRRINGVYYWLIPAEYHKTQKVPVDKTVQGYIEVDLEKCY